MLAPALGGNSLDMLRICTFLSCDKRNKEFPSLISEVLDKRAGFVKELNPGFEIETIELELRHDRLLAGGFHCVTLDLIRDE